MDFKYIRLLKIAAIINISLGVFLFICGILEFTNILPTPANNSIRTVGVQLSYLVFISGILLFASGGLTLLHRKTMRFVNLQIFAGVTSLAWPIFVSIALFFTTIPHTINIRLIPSTLSALFYIIALLIVKITNESLSRAHKINTRIMQTGKRKQGVNVAAVLSNAGGSKKSSVNVQSILGSAASIKTNNSAAAGAKRLFSGRRRSGGNPFKRLFNGQRRRSGGGLAKILYSGKRRRRR